VDAKRKEGVIKKVKEEVKWMMCELVGGYE